MGIIPAISGYPNISHTLKSTRTLLNCIKKPTPAGKQAKEVLQRDGVSVLLNMRLNTLVAQTAGMFDGTKKSILINSVIYKGLDGWTDPHKKRQRAEI